MRTRTAALTGTLSVSFAALLMAASAPAAAQQVAIDNDDIGGVVRSATGPEAGVWVVAETRELPTRYIKIVVTDAQGRYVIPDLPGRATYDIWVRGYGLVDSPKQKSTPGKQLNLTAVKAPSRAAAAEYYPAAWWYSMLKIPAANMFPGTGANGMSPTMKDQGLWLRYVKTDACVGCHQIGGKATRTIPAQLGHFNTGAEAWERRLQSGQAGRNMVDAIGRFDTQVQLANLGDWTDRISRGALPSSDPPRPQGRERNVVVTQWDWNTQKGYLHDEIATDRNNPTVNANGLIYGATEASSDMIPWLDPVDNTAGLLKTEFRNPRTPSTADNAAFYADSPYWGKEVVWDSHTNTHNPMIDSKGRLWLTARIRPADNPAFCKAGSNHPSARVFPTQTSGRQAEMYDPSTKQFTTVDLCFSTHHLQFDKSGILWFSSGGGQGGVIGWLDVNKFDQTKDEQASQAWSPFVLDTNGNGRRDAGWVEPNGAVDPTKDKRIVSGIYGVSPSPADGSVWGSVTGFPGGVLRFDPKTQLTEYYEVPWKNAKVPPQGQGFSPRGNDITTTGVVWTVLASGHLASFDRKLCNQNNIKGPTIADPQNACPEGWKLYQLPGPEFDSVKGVPGAAVEAPYYNWVDQHDTFGLGRDIPIATGNQTDSLAALVNGQYVVLRVAYPMGYFAKGLDGRIDDPAIGWKGKGLWSTYSTRAAHHIEGGKGNTSKVVKFQIRPDPLAK